MATSEAPKEGTIAWQDLTVKDAAGLRDFYSAVVGWTAQEFDGDFNMFPAGSTTPAAGICFARGANANLPPQWLLYIVVRNLTERAATCVRLGGTIVDGPRTAGMGRICTIRDPAGAVIALYEPAP